MTTTFSRAFGALALIVSCVTCFTPALAQTHVRGKVLEYNIKLSNATLYAFAVTWTSGQYKCAFPKTLHMASADNYLCTGSGAHDTLAVKLSDGHRHDCDGEFLLRKLDYDGHLFGSVTSSKSHGITCRITAGTSGQIKITE